MRGRSGVLIGVCRPVPDVLGFVTPVFRDRTGASIAQVVRDGRILGFEQIDLGEEFVPLTSSVTVECGAAALYAMEFEDCISLGSLLRVMQQASQAAWSDENAIKSAFETSRREQPSEFHTFLRTAEVAKLVEDKSDPESFEGEGELAEHYKRDPKARGKHAVSEEAAYWYVRSMDEPAMPQADRQLFLQWMRRSPQNIAELLWLVQLDETMSGRSLDATTSNVFDFPMADGSLARYRGHIPEAPDQAARRGLGRTLVAAAWAFVWLLLVGALGWVITTHPQYQQVVATGAGQWEQLTLADDTVVHIDANSKVEIEYSDQARIVHVLKGAAVFEVMQDRKRPFIARTRLFDVTAVGTRFGVAVFAGMTTTVSEGVVSVTRRGVADGTGRLVKAGEELHLSSDSPESVAATPVDAERKLSWTGGQLVLDGLTVAEAAAEFNRRNEVQIVLGSKLLGDQVVEFARIDADSPETYAAVVARKPGVKMTIDKKNRVIRLSE